MLGSVSSEPDQIVYHRPHQCHACQTVLGPEAPVRDTARRQVVDIPPIALAVTEYRTQTVLCAQCGAESSGTFAADVTHPVQYGPHLKALVVYLKQAQLIPYERTRQVLRDLFGVTISLGTLQTIICSAAERLRPVMRHIKQSLQQGHVLHCDESGFYIGGQRHWLHSASNRQLTYYLPHPARGSKALRSMGLLEHFGGTVIHDFYASYWTVGGAKHATCNVHQLRDLKAQEEQGDQAWATHFKRFLLAAKAAVAAAREAGESHLSTAKQAQTERLFARLVQAALRANPPPPEGWPRGKRGRPKKSTARNLAERIATHRPAILAFVYDFKVPFDNNLAERDIRMLKVQQKISGCFRSPQGADAFCVIRSYLSSLRKQKLELWPALKSLFSGSLIEPDYTPV